MANKSPFAVTLDEKDLDRDPVVQFRRWYDDALAAGAKQPDAMNLATATPDGQPSARLVLLKGVDERGFAFFTNYESRKGRELAANPRAALVLFWVELQRQVRVEGPVQRVSAIESDTYFNSRAYNSRISAAASPQSQVVPNREFLEESALTLRRRFPGETVPRPSHWGGYRVVPVVIEFWQGRSHRLHDRFRYRRLEVDGPEIRPTKQAEWIIERLAP